jgi:hypothetical protein
MAADPHPRYVLSADRLDVFDSWYCYREVFRSPRADDETGRTVGNTTHWKVRARIEAARLNLEHDAWLARGAA